MNVTLSTLRAIPGEKKAAARARPRSPHWASVATWRTRDRTCSAADILSYDVTFSAHQGPQGWPVFAPEEVKPSFQDVRKVAIRSTGGGSSEEEPTAEHENFPSRLGG